MRKSFLIFLLLNSISAILALFICPTKEGYFPDPEDKHKFYECSANIPYSFTCPEATIFDANTTQCQFDPDPNATTPTRTSTTTTPSVTTTQQTLATIPIATTTPPTEPPTTPTTPPTTPPTEAPTTTTTTTTSAPTTTSTTPAPTTIITTPPTTVSWAAQKPELEKKIKEIENTVSEILEQVSDASDAEKIAAAKSRINTELKIVESTESTVTELEKFHTLPLEKFWFEGALQRLALAKKHLNELLVLLNSFKF